MLVATQQPFYAFTKIGWIAQSVVDIDSIAMAAIGSSWYSRIGAAPYFLSTNEVRLAVERPPTTRADRGLLMAEVYAVAPDLFDGDLTGAIESEVVDDDIVLWWD